MQSSRDFRIPLVKAFYRFLRASLRLKTKGREDVFTRAREGESFIFASRHGQLLPLLFAVEDLSLTIMVSHSRDGELLASVLSPYDFELVRGSSSSKGRVAARDALRILGAGGRLGMAVDGPRGPRGVVQDGILRLAQRAGVSIVPLLVRGGHPLVLNKSWDHFEVPLPWTSVEVVIGSPVEIARGSEGLAEAGRQLAVSLNARFEEDRDRRESQPAEGSRRLA